jgi:hypothetical protein
MKIPAKIARKNIFERDITDLAKPTSESRSAISAGENIRNHHTFSYILHAQIL